MVNLTTALSSNLCDEVSKVIAYSQELDGLDPKKMRCENFIKQWYEAKKGFIEKFCEAGQESLIYEFPEEVSFSLDQNARCSKVYGFIDQVLELFYNWDIPSLITDDFVNFIKANQNTFHENKVSVEWMTNHGDKIQVGTKLLKAFKYFIHGGKHLEQIQQMASMIIQEGKITGYFCISVHPLDFLSASETNYNWRSCHALDGDYRSGNMAYAVDNCTVMCYLRGKEWEKLPRFPADVPWYSKKWRMLLFISPDNCVYYAGRQYPFEAKPLLDFVRHEVLPIVTGTPFKEELLNLWGGWVPPSFSEWNQYCISYLPQGDTPQSQSQYTRLYDNYLYIDGHLIPRRKLIQQSNELFYNDLTMSTKYIPSYCWNKNNIQPRQFYEPQAMKIGGNPICPCCGVNTVEFSDEMICVSCDDRYGTQDNDEFTRCHCCGVRILREDAYWNERDENYYCRDCYNDEEEEE